MRAHGITHINPIFTGSATPPTLAKIFVTDVEQRSVFGDLLVSSAEVGGGYVFTLYICVSASLSLSKVADEF